MVLPAPVGPTIAIFSPDFTSAEKFFIIILSGLYPNLTFLKLTFPFISSIWSFLPSSESISASKRKPNTLSLAAAVD